MINSQQSQFRTAMHFDTQWSRVILGLALVFGSIVRFLPTILTKFPILDGGMFYVAIGDILANGWRLPTTLTYNQLNIPFTYPPFGFYMAAVLEKIFRADRLDILRFLPPFYSLLLILAVYYLALNIFAKKSIAALAAALYALLPRSLWLIMGGSITRAPGMIFSILTIALVYLVCFKRDYKKKWFAMLFGSLTILSHPEAGIHTAGICMWVYLAAPHKRENFFQGIQIVGGVLLATSAWWITLLIRYGLQPIVSALGLGGGGIASSFMWPLINFAEEQFLPIITVTALWGAIFKLYKKEFLLPVWLCIPFLISHRSAPGYAIVPLALLGSLAVGELLTPAISAIRIKNTTATDSSAVPIFSILRVLAGVMIVYSFASAFWWGMLAKNNYVLSDDNRSAMQWVRATTPPEAHFLILTGETNPGQDEVQEWFPVLAERFSLTTIQGKEWLPDNQFSQAVESTQLLQTECLYADVSCIEDWGKKNQVEYDFVYVVNSSNDPYALPILDSMSKVNRYNLVYASPQKEIRIYSYQDQ